MKQTRFIMGMPIAIEIAGKTVNAKDIEEIFKYFTKVDEL
jgi:hypothetical protein